MRKHVKDFVFTGLLTKHVVNDMQASGLLHRPDARQHERREGDLFSAVQEAIRSGSLQMQYAYRILFVLENVVRQLIVSRLIDADGPSWFEKRASTPMKKRVAQRRETEQKNQWHSGRNREPIYYLDFGDLGRLITNHWEVFADLLPNETWVRGRLDDAERTRNVIAHTNLLPSEEVARLERCLSDWVKQIG